MRCSRRKPTKPPTHRDFPQALPSMVSAPEGVTVGAEGRDWRPATWPHPLPAACFPRSPWQPHGWPGGSAGRGTVSRAHLGKPALPGAAPGGLPLAPGGGSLAVWTGCGCTDPHQVTGHRSDESPVLAGPQSPPLAMRTARLPACPSKAAARLTRDERHGTEAAKRGLKVGAQGTAGGLPAHSLWLGSRRGQEMGRAQGAWSP